MNIKRAYKTKLDPNDEQCGYFSACAGTARFVFNWALADRKAMFEAGGKPNKFEQKRRFNAWKKENAPWLANYPYVILQEEFDHVDVAYQNFFRRVKQGSADPGFPRFKSRHRDKQSFTLRGSITVEAGRIKLPKMGWVRLAESGYIPTEGIRILFVVVSRTAADWFVSVQVEQEIADPQPAQGAPLGVDLGIKSLAVCSDGVTFDNPHTLRKYTRKMDRLQRELSRRTIKTNKRVVSKNARKTVKKIAALHQTIANVRRHTQHNISRHATAITKPSVVVVEDLNVKGMMANHNQAKAVADVGMGELRRQIEYKAAWSGVRVVVADRWFASSKTCSKCGNIKDTLDRNERVYRCEACGAELDRDLNAAMNLAALV